MKAGRREVGANGTKNLSADYTDYIAQLRPQPNHTERIKVNSRGRAALREAHGSN